MPSKKAALGDQTCAQHRGAFDSYIQPVSRRMSSSISFHPSCRTGSVGRTSGRCPARAEGAGPHEIRSRWDSDPTQTKSRATLRQGNERASLEKTQDATNASTHTGIRSHHAAPKLSSRHDGSIHDACRTAGQPLGPGVDALSLPPPSEVMARKVGASRQKHRISRTSRDTLRYTRIADTTKGATRTGALARASTRPRQDARPVKSLEGRFPRSMCCLLCRLRSPRRG